MTGSGGPAGDPWRADEPGPDDAGFDDYLRWADPARLDRDGYRVALQAFDAAWEAALDGRGDGAALRDAAAGIDVRPALRHDARRAAPAPACPDDALLANIAEDQVPDVSVLARDAVLGPWADRPVPLALRTLAAALLAGAPLLEPEVSAIDRWCKVRPRPDPADRAAVRAWDQAPAMLYAVEGGALRPLLPLSPGFSPAGVVAGVPVAPAVVGRAVLTADGWALASALPLAQVPPVPPILSRLWLERAWMQRRERRTTWEDALRRRPWVVYRAVIAQVWLAERGEGGG